MFTAIYRAIGRRLASFLTKESDSYQRIDAITIAEVAASLRAGDVLLVEGNSRISTAIKYLSQSSWSHACLFVGASGEASDQLNLLEANLKYGVQLVSLDKYAVFNLRICRPVNLSDDEIERLVATAKSKLGHRYDLKNVFDLLRYLIQKPAVPERYRRAMISFGSGEPTQAICSTVIAESFQSIDYPILPRRHAESKAKSADEADVLGEVPLYYRRHFTHFTPRDFDLSPYFQIVKPSIEASFDYHQMRWKERPDSNS